MASGITSVLGIHVAWQGVAFGFTSMNGEPISATVLPVCSSAYSISIYLALLGLMYLDMRKSIRTTAMFAIFGVLVIPLLDSVRIALTIWFGYLYGLSAFWEIHDWLGYAIFLMFYLAVLASYSRTSKPRITYAQVSPPVRI